MFSNLSTGDTGPTDVLDDRRNLLVVAPTSNEMGDVPRRLLAEAADPGESAVVVSTRERARDARARFERVDALAPDRLGVVDCTPQPTGSNADPDSLWWTVSSPMELTRTNIALSQCMDELAGRGFDAAHLVVDSLSTPLRSGDSDLVLRFAHQIQAAPGAQSGTGLFPVYTAGLDDHTIEVLKGLFDGLVEVRVEGNRRELRWRGIPDVSTEWRPVEDLHPSPTPTRVRFQQ